MTLFTKINVQINGLAKLKIASAEYGFVKQWLNFVYIIRPVCSLPVFLFAVLPVFVQSVEGALVNMTDDQQQNNLRENCQLLGEKVKMMKSALKWPTGINIGGCVCVSVCVNSASIHFDLFVSGFLPQMVFSPKAF